MVPVAEDRPRLATPRIKVTPPEGDPFTVQVINQDMVAYDVTSYRHKWPPMDKAPFLWLTFLSWHAARRLGVIDGSQGYEDFRDTVLTVEAENPEGDAVDPTDAAPDPD